MKYRIMGRTGISISEFGFGCLPLMRLPIDESVQILRYAFDKGITFYDTASSYKDSELKLGKAFYNRRHKVIIATKTAKRDASGVNENLINSLQMLQTDYIDLYQLHQVSKEKDFNTIISSGGALEALIKAKRNGHIRNIGVSSHNYDMAIKLVKTNLFDTIQFPFNFIETKASDQLHLIAEELKLGIIAMKPFAGGALDNASLVFKFLRQYPDVIPIPGFDSISYIDEVLDLYKKPNIISEEELTLMNEYRTALGNQFCRRCEYCQPCPNGVMITRAMMYSTIAKKLSDKISLEPSTKIVMKTVLRCTKCGSCIHRCPYGLSIPEILNENYNLFEQHKLGYQ